MARNQTRETSAEQLQRRNRELSILMAIAGALNQSVELEQALRATLAQVATLLDLRTGWIWLLDEESGASYLAAAQNLPPGLTANPHRMEGRCYCLDTFRAGDLEGAANVNVVTCSRLRSLVDGTDGLRYHASIPLYAHNKKLGVLNVASTDWRELSPDDLNLLHAIGDLLGIAVERARLFTRSAHVGAVEERNRLAREIHDTLAQGLAAVALQLESVDALLDAGADAERLREGVLRALGLTRANLEEARRSVLDLRAAPLEGQSLVKALETLARETRLRRGKRVAFEVTGAGRPLPMRIEVGVFRIAQEALTNVARHSHATSARLSLTMTPEEVRLVVDDNGDGFDASRIPHDRFGLRGMSERARLLNGELRLATCPGEGTLLDVIVPLGASQ
ncbi:MAG TPA: GAF domain-containing sensor histidine kinase [Ktedonobacterales bacterium]|nr:GAF domain-containing sensor histidine kinase [Ktedonobacterales bacterium]